jgi:hypothetical protein
MPTWTKINTGLPTDKINWFNADPYQPSVTQYCITQLDRGDGTTTQMWIRQSGGSWTSLLTQAQAHTAIDASGLTHIHGGYTHGLVIADIHRQGFVATIISNGSNWFWLQSLDYGTSWTCLSKMSTTAFNAGALAASIGFYKGNSTLAAGKIIYAAVYRAGTGGESHLVRSNDQGATWTDYVMSALTPHMDMWTNSTIQVDLWQDVIYALVGANAAPNAADKGLWRSADRGATWTQLFSTYAFGWGSVIEPAKGYSFQPLYDYTNPAFLGKTLRMTGMDLTSSGGRNNDIWKSTDFGATWTRYTVDATLVGTIGFTCLGDADGKLYGTYVTQSAASKPTVWASVDEGVTWDPKAGTDVTNTTTTGIPGANGGIVALVPVYDV